MKKVLLFIAVCTAMMLASCDNNKEGEKQVATEDKLEAQATNQDQNATEPGNSFDEPTEEEIAQIEEAELNQ